MPEPPVGPRPGVRLRGLVLGLALLQVLLHAWAALAARDPRRIPPHLLALLTDLLLLWLAALAVLALEHRVPAARHQFLHCLGVLAVLLLGALLAVYPPMLGEYLAFPVDLLSGDLGAARVLVSEYLGPARLWPLLGVGLVAASSGRIPVRWTPSPRALALGGLLLALPVLPTLTRSSPHPLACSLQQKAWAWIAREPRTVPSLRPPVRAAGVSNLPEAVLPTGLDRSRYRKVFLLVLEGVTAGSFERDFLERPGGFHRRVREQARYFSGYRSTNLDSYTSLIAMLTGLQVPYRAYADEGRYRAVNAADNLARRFRGAGYRTLFLSTYDHQPFVPNRQDWDRVLDRRDLGELKGWAGVGGSRMEAATEDRAALGPMMAGLADRTFVLQELVYGHSPQWQATTGLAPLAYYDAYLQDLLDRLEARGWREESLIVVVSDHGDRAAAADAENHRVPLLVVGGGLPSGRDAALRSHLDLPAILGACLGIGPLPEPRASVRLVGSTDRWVYGEARAGGDHLFIDDASGRILAGRGGLDPAALHRDFQVHLDAFHARFGP